MVVTSNEIRVQQRADSLVLGGDSAGIYTVWWCYKGSKRVVSTGSLPYRELTPGTENSMSKGNEKQERTWISKDMKFYRQIKVD